MKQLGHQKVLSVTYSELNKAGVKALMENLIKYQKIQSLELFEKHYRASSYKYLGVLAQYLPNLKSLKHLGVSTNKKFKELKESDIDQFVGGLLSISGFESLSL